MKKILTASLVAMMAVTAANANIASTKYVDDRTGTLSGFVQENTNLTTAVNALAATVSTNAGAASDAAAQALADAKAYTDDLAEGAVADNTAAIAGMDLDSVGADGSYIKTVSQADGKVTAVAEAADAAPTQNSTKMVTSGGVYTALALKEDIANRVVVDGDIEEGRENSQYPTIAYLELTTKNITDGVAGNLSEMEQSIEDLRGELETEVEDLQNADAANLQEAKDYADSQDAAQTTTITNAYTAAIKAETDARTAKDTELQNAINAINNDESGILAEAKEYADAQDATQTNTITTAYTSAIATAKSGAESTAKAYTDTEIAKIDTAYKAADATLQGAIDAINNAESGILADAKEYADTQDAAQTTALQQYADQAEADAIAAAKAAGDSAYAAKSYEARVEGNETDIGAIKTNLGPLDVEIPAACAEGETCSLVMKKGQVAWEVISY